MAVVFGQVDVEKEGVGLDDVDGDAGLGGEALVALNTTTPAPIHRFGSGRNARIRHLFAFPARLSKI